MDRGTFIKSTSLLENTFFEDAIILLTELNEKGAIGFVVNKPFPRKLNELEEFRHSLAFPLYDGGPVDREHLFFLHQCPELITGGDLITDNIYLGGDFKKAIRGINNGTITGKNIKMFIGYCGWDEQELQTELGEGSWLICKDAILF